MMMRNNYIYSGEPGSPHEGLLWLILMSALAITLGMMLAGCKTTQYVPVVEHRTDTVQITKHQRDSIWLHDSVHVHEYMRGDTVYMAVDKWHTKYIGRSTHDTIYVATHDSIPVPYPKEVEVEKPLTRWQQMRMHMGDLLLALLAVAIVRRAKRMIH
jgi:hypothetical protein